MPDSFHLGPLVIYYYSLTLAAGVWASYFLAQQHVNRLGLTKSQITDLIVILFVSGIVGARLGFIVQNIGYYREHATEIIGLTTSGLSIHGGILGGALALYWYAKKHDLLILKLTDYFALPLLLGQTVGRLGNYFNQELFGYPTSVPWRIFIDSEHRPAEYPFSSYFHPTFAYEIILNLIGFAVLSRLPHKKTGQLTAGYLIVFSLSRFIVEIFRISERLIAGLSLAQLVSIGLAAAGIILWLRTEDPAKRSQ